MILQDLGYQIWGPWFTFLNSPCFFYHLHSHQRCRIRMDGWIWNQSPKLSETPRSWWLLWYVQSNLSYLNDTPLSSLRWQARKSPTVQQEIHLHSRWKFPLSCFFCEGIHGKTQKKLEELNLKARFLGWLLLSFFGHPEYGPSFCGVVVTKRPLVAWKQKLPLDDSWCGGWCFMTV